MRFVVFALAFAVAACDPPPATGCEPACASQAPACDNGCPAVADEVCVDGSCAAVEAGTADLAITVNIDRGLAGVVALAIAVVDARVASCADVGAVADATGVLAGNRVEVAGGTFHPDIPEGGLVPEGAVIVAVDALDDASNVVGSGCEAADAADGAEVLVTVE